MSDKKKDDGEKRSGTDTARRIWLAGIGAYGRAFTEAQEAFKDVTGEASDVFDNLVQKGEMIELAVQSKRKDVMSKVGAGNFEMPELDMNKRIEKMRSRLQSRQNGADLSQIEARLERIEEKLDQILSGASVKPAPKRKSTAKMATVKTPARARKKPKPS